MKTIPIMVLTAIFAAAHCLHAGNLESIRTNLEAQVGGKWAIDSHQESFPFLYPQTLPANLPKGTYAVFASDTNRSALVRAETWMETCQAPFFILGTNKECVVITYVPRKHQVSQSIIKTLALTQPQKLSPAEAMSLKQEGYEAK
jgi:hypothetical protein